MSVVWVQDWVIGGVGDRESTYDWLRTETFKVGSRLISEWIMTYEKRKLNSTGDMVDELDWTTK